MARSYTLRGVAFQGSLLASVAWGLCGGPAAAETKTVNLPQAQADFALDPDTGAIAAVDAEASTATLFRKAYFTGDAKALAGPVRVGATPCSIAWKRFGKKTYFAVVCTQDSHMYVLDAETFELVKKVVLASAGVSSVTCSTNPEDPFLYYCFGSGHESMCGAVDVRQMTDCGSVFDHSMDCAISASGKTAYRRGPWSPSGFESLRLMGSLADEKPKFVRGFYDHTSIGRYVPDAADQFTAAGATIYSCDLSKKVATLNFVPECFFKTKPLVVGLSGIGRFSMPRPGRGQMATTARLQAASYNTFSAIGEPVEVPPEFTAEAKALPRGVMGQGDFKRVTLRNRLFADDQGEQVIYAFQGRVLFVPLAEFHLPDEPFLQVALQGETNVVVGKACELVLEKKDARSEITIEQKPDGMEIVADRIRWTPTAEQVGEQTLALTIKHKDLQRTQNFELNVACAFTRLPWPAQGLAVDESVRAAICWERPGPNRMLRGVSDLSAERGRIAVVDLQERKLMVEKRLPYVVGAAAIGDKQCFVAAQGGNHVEVLDRETLQSVKTLYAESPVVQIEATAKRLVVQENGRSAAYALPSLERLAVSDGSPANLQADVVNGLLMDEEGKQPLMVIQPGKFPSLPLGGQVMPNEGLGSDGNRDLSRPYGAAVQPFYDPSGGLRSGRIVLDKVAAAATAEVKVQNINVSIQTYRQETDLTLVLSDLTSGALKRRIPLAKISIPGGMQDGLSALVLQGRGQAVAVLFRDQLFRWDAAGLKAEEFPKPMRFVPQKTARVLAQGKTTLEHQLAGGKGPYQYRLLAAVEGMQLDEKTGTLTIDPESLLAQGETYLANRYFTNRFSGLAPADALKNFCFESMADGTRMIGRKPQGVLLAIPIGIRGMDSESQAVNLHYYIFAEVPYARLVARLKKMTDSLPTAVPPVPGPAAANPPAAGGTEDLKAEVASLRQKVETMQAQLDMVTRELSALRRDANKPAGESRGK